MLEAHLLANEDARVAPGTFDRERAIFPEEGLAFKRGDIWRHTRITLKPINPEYKPIVLTGADDEELQVIAELVEVLASE